MPPRYQPLQIPVNPPPGIMNVQEATPYDEFEKREAALLAQRLNNQSVGISVDQRQRQYDQQLKQEAKAKEIFGPQADGTTPEFDSDKLMDIIKRTAVETGDFNTAINAEKAQRQYQNPNNQLLTPEQLIEFDLEEGSTVADAKLAVSMRNSGVAAGHLDIRKNDPNRELSAEQKRRKLAGTEFQKVSDAEIGKLENADGALESINEIVNEETGLLLQLDPGALSALKAGKLTGKYKDPGSPAYRMYARLELLKKQVARMNDSGALTQLDVDMFEPLTVGSPIYDDKNSVATRMYDLTSYIQKKQESIIKRNEQGYRNMDRFKKAMPGNQNPDDLANSLAQDPVMDEETAFKEAHKKKLRERLQQQGG